METAIQQSDGAPARRGSPWLYLLGTLFIVIWLAASGIWFAMSMMGALMANDSGAATSSAHSGMIIGILCGQALTTIAGVAGGLAIFWRKRRAMLVWAFVMLLCAGVLWQYQSFQSFSAVSGSRS